MKNINCVYLPNFQNLRIRTLFIASFPYQNGLFSVLTRKQLIKISILQKKKKKKIISETVRERGNSSTCY